MSDNALMDVQTYRSKVYVIVRDDDISASTRHLPSLEMEFGPKRRTIKWRGRRFNVPEYRIVRVGHARA